VDSRSRLAAASPTLYLWIPDPDAMVAATARRRGERLVAADGHFERVNGLDYVNVRS